MIKFSKIFGKFSSFFQKYFFIFYVIEKNNIFFEVEKKNGYSFDAEKSYLSIGGVFRAIRANTKTLEST